MFGVTMLVDTTSKILGSGRLFISSSKLDGPDHRISRRTKPNWTFAVQFLAPMFKGSALASVTLVAGS